MRYIKLLGTEKDRTKSFNWMVTHTNTVSINEDEFRLSEKDFKKFKRNAFFRRFKYGENEMVIYKCPYGCKDATFIQDSPAATTLAYYEPIYNERGENINPDKNVTSYIMKCLKCGKRWRVSSQYGTQDIISLLDNNKKKIGEVF